MKRRTFLSNTACAAPFLYINPISLLSNNSKEDITAADLMGKAELKFKNDNIRLREDAYNAFLNMQRAAKNDGIEIMVVSAYRSYDRQKNIWNRKYKSYTNSGLSPQESIQKIIEYSTMPGTSRHHWGTDIDIIDGSVPQPKNVLSPEHFEPNGPFTRLKNWVIKNANKYGFYLVYTNNPDRKGFKYEPWHYSYKPLSEKYLQAYKNQEIINNIVTDDLDGGSYITKEFLNTYYTENILDINPELL